MVRSAITDGVHRLPPSNPAQPQWDSAQRRRIPPLPAPGEDPAPAEEFVFATSPNPVPRLEAPPTDRQTICHYRH